MNIFIAKMKTSNINRYGILLICTNILMLAVCEQQLETVVKACKTPSELDGVCILSIACPEFLALAKNRGATQEERMHLKKYFCTSVNPGYDRVCCVSPQMTVPSFLKICHRNDPKLNECLSESMGELIPHFAQGDLKYAIKCIEPLFIGNLLDGVPIGLFNWKVYLENVSLSGWTDGEMSDVTFSFENETFVYSGVYDKISLRGNYKSVGSLFGLVNVTTFGKMTGIFKMTIEFMIKFKIVKRGDNTYMEITKVTTKIKIENPDIMLHKIITGDDAIINAYRRHVSHYSIAIADIMTPMFEKLTSNIYFEGGNEFLLHYTFDQLFPE